MTDGSGEPSRIRRLWRWFTRPLCFGGLVGAVVFFFVSFTPSLVPRTWIVQGILAALTAAIGYGLGSAGSALLRKVLPQEPGRSVKRRAWIGLAIAAPIVMVLALWLGAQWDQQLRELMEMDLDAVWNDIGTVIVALVVFAVLMLVSRAVRGVWRLLVGLVNRWLPRPWAVALGGVAAIILLVFVLAGGLAEALFRSIDTGARIANETFEDDVEQPTSPNRSGSPDSPASWDDLGAKGRQFVTGGPSVEELSEFTGRSAIEPIRLYAGVQAADSIEDRVALLLDELDRTDAWSRSAILVQTPSGNGEIPRVNADAPEYIFNGDVAQVALQYSYAPSFSTMVLKPGAGDEAARQMIAAVATRLAELPEAERPALFVAGESLGSSSTEGAFDDLDDLVRTVDGALFVGPTFFNDIRNDLTAGRDDGSPVWLPVIDDGAFARFARAPDDLSAPTDPWDGTRVVYLQNSSDPVAWFDLDLLWSRPEFLDDPRGPDVSPAMTWFPFVTFWQTLVDLPFASGAPAGHGHRYGLNVADGWVAVMRPTEWTDADTARLREVLDEG